MTWYCCGTRKFTVYLLFQTGFTLHISPDASLKLSLQFVVDYLKKIIF
jgi:hypothetical protein